MDLKGLIYDSLKDNLPRLQKERKEDLSRWQAWCGNQNGKIVMFGASVMCELCIRYLEELGIYVDVICDNNSSQHGIFTTDSGRNIDIISVDEAMSDKAKKLCFVATGAEHFADISLQLGRYQIAETVMKWHLALYLETVIMMRDQSAVFMDRIRELLEFYDDEESLQILWTHFAMLFQLDNVPEILQQLSMEKLCVLPQYFLKDGKYLEKQNVMVDCGAYIGDTLEDLLYKTKYDQFERYDCYEMFPSTYKELRRMIENLPREIQNKVRSYNVGLGEKNAVAYAVSGPTAEHGCILCNGDTEVIIASLDDLYQNEDVTFIKMDIEGSEQAALRGAKKLIKRCRPMCVICVYHTFSAFWEIPQLLKEYVPEYRMILRHHTTNWPDTVCYAKIGAWE